MALLKIARMGHPVLLQRAAPIPDPTHPDIRRLVADMFETMADAGGVGLAAPQVHVPLRLFVYAIPAARAGDDPADTSVEAGAVINPEIDPLGEERVSGWEGCLSIPGMRGLVPRAARIRLRGVDAEGRPIDRELAGFRAIVAQHEFDHLNGVLYPMRMTDFAQFGFVEELGRAQAAAQQQGAAA